MIRKLVVIMTVVASITESIEASPSPHHHDDDPYESIIRLLKEARKQRRYEGSIRESASSQNSQFQFPTSSNSGSSLGGNDAGQSTPILRPNSGSGSNGGSGNFGTIGSAISGAIPPAGGSSSNYPPILPNFPSGSQIVGQLGNGNLPRPPYPIEQVNRGVSTILNGVRSLDLGQILRGAFVFPRNENVRSVANNVLDSIFGNAKQSSTGGARL